tara:strand:+ start:630 stop:890 length:261 start_codon:yes stop_codon:yes gene_type:complete
MVNNTPQAKWYEAFETVIGKHNEFVPFSKIYNEFYDEMRSMGIKSQIPTRRQFAQFTTIRYLQRGLLLKETKLNNRRKEVHYKMVK